MTNLHTIKKIDTDGTITTAAMYCNEYTERYNLQTFIISNHFRQPSAWWNIQVREKADVLITESAKFLYFEDTSGIIYSIRKL